MKKVYFFLSITLFFSCVGEDIIDDEVPEVLRITNIENEIQLGNTLQLEATYFNNVGQEAQANILWSSSNEEIAAVSNTGIISANSLGNVIITASTNGIEDNSEFTIIEGDDAGNLNNQITGNIFTTSSYVLSGDFTLSIIDETNLLLSLSENYIADIDLPGLYVYLSNNPDSVADALEIGKVNVFNGHHSYTIEATGLNDFAYIVYWCKPFSVKVGQGDLQN